MARYRCNEPVVVDGKHRRKGDIIELSEKEAGTFPVSITPLDVKPPKSEPKSDSDNSNPTSEKK